jgi:hypothetical protein
MSRFAPRLTSAEPNSLPMQHIMARMEFQARSSSPTYRRAGLAQVLSATDPGWPLQPGSHLAVDRPSIAWASRRYQRMVIDALSLAATAVVSP